MKKYIFFDLDGTLTDSAEGITNSVEYALNHYGISVQDKSSLNVFVGPPLVDSFMKYYGFDHEKARKSVGIYREYFETKGMFENAVYPRLVEFLHFDIQSTGQKSHCVNIRRDHRNALF